jgi:hypothetical protein
MLMPLSQRLKQQRILMSGSRATPTPQSKVGKLGFIASEEFEESKEFRLDLSSNQEISDLSLKKAGQLGFCDSKLPPFYI